MKLVIKIGGAALDDEQTVRQCSSLIAHLASDGGQILVVHGGGAALTRTLTALGHESHFINGLRFTDETTRDVALMVLAGQINKRLVAALSVAGASAIGLCGGDLRVVQAERKRAAMDLGFVGTITRVDERWISTFWSHAVVPVIASIALGEDGEYYNVNADEVASACAVATSADALVFLTDVPGVRGADGHLMRTLESQHIPDMIRASAITGGMLPKLEACTRALKHGVRQVHIVPAASARILSGLHQGKVDCGTEVVLS